MSSITARGVFFVHSAPSALCLHIEWMLGSLLDREIKLAWTDQPAATGMLRAEFAWEGRQGTGARIASALRGWEHLRYEVTEEPSRGADGGRWSHTPQLGIFYAMTDVHGNSVVPEDRVKNAIESGQHDISILLHELDLATGRAWDDELEPFRYASDGAPVRWLHKVG